MAGGVGRRESRCNPLNDGDSFRDLEWINRWYRLALRASRMQRKWPSCQEKDRVPVKLGMIKARYLEFDALDG